MGSPNLVPIPRVGDAGGVNRALRKLASLALGPDSTPTFAEMTITSMTVSGLTASRLLATNADNLLVSSDLDAWVAGTENEIDVAQNGGGVTLSLAAGAVGTLDHDTLLNVHQDVNTDASPTFAGVIPETDDTNDLGLVEEGSPSYDLEVEQALSNASGTVTLTTYKGATFTPLTGFTIAQVAFKLRRSPGGIGNLTMHLTATTAGVPSGGDLASVTVAGATIIPDENQDTWAVFTFDTPYLLTQDDKYAVFMTLDAAASNKYTQYFYQNMEVLDDSEYLQDAGSGWQNIPTWEGTFRIYSYNEAETEYTRWENLYLSGLLHDGTVSLSVANAKAAYDFTTALNAATDGQLMIGDTGDNPVLATLTGTANQITIAGGAGSITLSLPDSFTLPAASPTFAGGTFTGLTASQVVGTTADKALVSLPVIGSGLNLEGGNLYWSWLGMESLSEAPAEDSMMVWNGPGDAVLWEDGATLRTTLGIGTGDSPTFVGLTLTGKLGVGSQAAPIDVTNTRQYGFEIHYSGNDYSVTGIRSRAQLVTTDTSATALGGLFQAANNDDVDAGVLMGFMAEAIGKSTANASTISTMRGGLIGTEWGALDTVTNLKTLHLRGHSRNAAGAGSFGTGYALYIENEAVGGNGQAYDAGIYFKDTNLSAGNKAFTYGIDFSGGSYGTADIRLQNGEIIENAIDGTIGFGSANLVTTGGLTVSGNTILDTSLTVDTDLLVADAVTRKVEIGSVDGSDKIQLFMYGGSPSNNAFVTWSDGSITFRTTEGTNTNSELNVKGKGTGIGAVNVFDQDDAEFMQIFAFNGIGGLSMGGTSPVALSFQPNARIGIRMFNDSTTGETQELTIFGFRTSDQNRSLEIGVGVDAADTASFDGLSNYLFDGNIEATGNVTVAGTITQNAVAQTISGSKTLVDNTATGFVDIAISPDGLIGGHILYYIHVKGDNDELQSHSGTANFSSINKLETVTSDIEEAYLPAREVEVMSAGTLTDNFTITNTDGDPGKITINCDVNSNLDNPVLILYYTIIMHSLNTITTL